MMDYKQMVDTAFELAKEWSDGKTAGVLWKLNKFKGLQAAWLGLQIAAALPSDLESDFTNQVEALALGRPQE